MAGAYTKPVGSCACGGVGGADAGAGNAVVGVGAWNAAVPVTIICGCDVEGPLIDAVV